MSSTDYFPARLSQKPVTTGSLCVIAVVTVILFVPTLSGHVAVMNANSIELTSTEYTMVEDGDTLLVSLEISNPTRRSYEVVSANLYLVVDGHVVSHGSLVDGNTVPSGGTASLAAEFSVLGDDREQTKEGIRSGTVAVTGQLRGTVGDASVSVDVNADGRNVNV